MQGAHTDGVRAAQWVGPPSTWLTSGLRVGPLKTQLKSTASCRPTPSPGPLGNKCHIVPPAGLAGETVALSQGLLAC